MMSDQLLVQTIMTTNTPVIGPDTTMLSAAQAMVQSQTRHLLVTDDSGELLGVVSDRDVLKHLQQCLADPAASAEAEGALQQCPVEEIMTCPSFSVVPSTPVDVAAAAFIFDNADSVPVLTEYGKLVGVVTRERVSRLYIEQEFERAMAPVG